MLRTEPVEDTTQTMAPRVWHPTKDVSTHKSLLQMFCPYTIPIGKLFRGHRWIQRVTRTQGTSRVSIWLTLPTQPQGRPHQLPLLSCLLLPIVALDPALTMSRLQSVPELPSQCPVAELRAGHTKTFKTAQEQSGTYLQAFSVKTQSEQARIIGNTQTAYSPKFKEETGKKERNNKPTKKFPEISH